MVVVVAVAVPCRAVACCVVWCSAVLPVGGGEGGGEIGQTVSLKRKNKPNHVLKAVLKGKMKTFVTPTETHVHGDALCFLVMGPSLLQRLVVGGWWQLAVGGGWRLVVPGGCP